jgi:predicted regulator of Ras-like GTPase activity (Roadblock/LC7/MglB family)
MAQALSESLQELQASNGLEMAAVVGSDGLVVESASVPGVDAEEVCAMAASGLLMMDALGRALAGGSAQNAILEFDGHTVMLAPLDDDNLIVLLAGGDANLGRMRIVMRRAMDNLREGLQNV